MYSKIVEDDEMNHCARVVMMHFEHISICIQESYVDERVIYLDLNYMLPYYYVALVPYIEGERIRTRNNSIYIEFEKLAISWQAGKLLSSGDLVPEVNS
jgi:hypothetical protein